jgi:hypothetical protein
VRTPNATKLITAATLAVLTIANSSFALAASADVARVFHDADGARVRLSNGDEFKLNPISPAVRREVEEHAARLDAAKQSGRVNASLKRAKVRNTTTPPDEVDHRRFHGPIRNQDGRGTCVAHSTVAAVEGFYRRQNPERFADLDLSEQYLNHVQKMVNLAGAPVSERRSPALDSRWHENELGCWGGSFNQYAMRVLQQYGVPTEETLRYNPLAAYEDTNELTDDPQIDPRDVTVSQRVVNDFNLDGRNLPITALDSASFRPTRVVELMEEQIRDPQHLEKVLAAGHDIVFDMVVIKPIGLNADGAWSPTPNAQIAGGHSVLIVGYNRAKQYFIVRNSWSDKSPLARDNGYDRISYEYVRRYGLDGSYITAVADPSQSPDPSRALIGRWKLQFGGMTFTLDINRLPGLFRSTELNGQADRRVGAMFAGERAYRVNGVWKDGTLVLVVNAADPNLAYGSLNGTEFRIDALSRDQQTLQGIATSGANQTGFEAARIGE